MTHKALVVNADVPIAERKRRLTQGKDAHLIIARYGKGKIPEGSYERYSITVENNILCIADILCNTDKIKHEVEVMSDYLEEAGVISTDAIEKFRNHTIRLRRVEADMVEASKSSASKMKRSYNALSNSLEKIESTANFDRLETLTGILERAACAMTTLAKLDSEGRLERIAAALK